MAGAFSGHLLESFYNAQQSQAPFGSPTPPSNLSISGAMSFNPHMHGSSSSSAPSALSASRDPYAPPVGLSAATAARLATLQAKLNQKLGPEFVSQRAGPGGAGRLTYAEGWKMINLANEVFGFNGWSSSVASLSVDFVDFSEETRRYSVGVTAVVRVTLRDGVFHEDVGYGLAEGMKSKGSCFDKCKKEAVTDALKRALRNFGNLLGNCLYDKSYTQEVVKMKVPPPKFEKDQLYRRPEFAEPKSNAASAPAGPSASTSTSAPATSAPAAAAATATVKSNAAAAASATATAKVKLESTAPAMRPPAAPADNSTRRASAIPPHVRSAMQSAIDASSSSSSSGPAAPAPRGVPTGLQTPAPAGPSTSAGDGDDSSVFASDDDAFFAAVDLGEGDLGCPIECEEPAVEAAGEAEHREGAHIPGAPRRALPPGAAPGSARESGEGGQGAAGGQRQLLQRHATVGPGAVASTPRGPPGAQTPHLPLVHAPAAAAGRAHDENAPPPALANASANGNARRPPAPAAGGFHFPPGADAPGGAGWKRQLQQLQQAASSAGTKRGHDGAPQAPMAPVRRAGMGLAQQQQGQGCAQQQGQQRRAPLGRLEVGEGGEVKRQRR